MQMHEVVDLATSDAPPAGHTVDEIVASGRRRQRRLRASWTAAGAAGLAVVAVAATAVLPSLLAGNRGVHRTATAGNGTAANKAPVVRKAAPQPFTEAAAPFTFTFKAFDAGPFHVADPVVASNTYQIASVYMTGMVTNDKPVDPTKIVPKSKQDAPPTLYAYLTLYRPGAFNPDGIKGAQKLTVDGHQARLKNNVGGDSGNRLLAWQYADSAWAALNTYSSDDASPSADDLKTVVSGLSASPAVPAKIPFTMGYVPAGYQPVEIGSGVMSGLNGIAAAREGDFGGAVFAKPIPSTTGLTEPYGGSDGNDLPGSFKIFIVPSQNSNQQLKGAAPKQPKCGHGFCNRWSPDGAVQIQVASDGRLTDSEMSRIAKGITLADVHNPASWPAASKALSGK